MIGLSNALIVAYQTFVKALIESPILASFAYGALLGLASFPIKRR